MGAMKIIGAVVSVVGGIIFVVTLVLALGFAPISELGVSLILGGILLVVGGVLLAVSKRMERPSLSS